MTFPFEITCLKPAMEISKKMCEICSNFTNKDTGKKSMA